MNSFEMRKWSWSLIAFSAVIILGFTLNASAQEVCRPDFQRTLKNVPMNEWIARYEEARAENESFAVESVDEFIKITDYYDKLVRDGRVTHSFNMQNGQQIYCIDVRSQSSVRSAGLDPDDIPSSPAKAPAVHDASGINDKTGVYQAGFGLDGSLDEWGCVRECPDGSFPKLIKPIETYYHFRKFNDIFRKYPDDVSPAWPKISPDDNTREITHQYGIIYGNQENTGEIGDFNLWSPKVINGGWFSLAQLWVARGEGNNLQTVETGWQVYPLLYGNKKANLFIFYTTDGYQTGCYNLDCDGFVQTDPSVVIGGMFDHYSEIGGDQYQVTIGFVRDGAGGNHWWLKVNDIWVGFYPTTLFDSQGIQDYNELINFGGELIDNSKAAHVTSEMGSGRFPVEGYQYAAYIRKIQYMAMDGQIVDADNIFSMATMPECWDVSAVDYNSQDDWRTNFFFGGVCGTCAGCLISSICYNDGDENPGNICEICDKNLNNQGWSFNNGVSCDDHKFCNGPDSCKNGNCSVHEGNPCNSDEICNEEKDICEKSDDDNDAVDDDTADDDESDDDTVDDDMTDDDTAATDDDVSGSDDDSSNGNGCGC